MILIPLIRFLIRRLIFSEIVKASPEKITVTAGNDLYLRLENPTEHFDTCELIRPNEDNAITYEVDETHIEKCGFKVSGVQINDTGRWEIIYGERIIYKAPVQVIVIGEESHLKTCWKHNGPGCVNTIKEQT